MWDWPWALAKPITSPSETSTLPRLANTTILAKMSIVANDGRNGGAWRVAVALPAFTADGLLPIGDHELTVDELRQSMLVVGYPAM